MKIYPDEVLTMLIPDGGWVITGDTYEGIEFLTCEPITEKQFLDGFAQYETWKNNQEAEKKAQRAALLERLGLTADEAKLLIG